MPHLMDNYCCNNFSAGIPQHVSRQLRAMGDTRDLQQVVEKACLLMTIEQSEHLPTPINAVQDKILANCKVKLQIKHSK